MFILKNAFGWKEVLLLFICSNKNLLDLFQKIQTLPWMNRHILLVLNFRRLRHEALHFGDEKSHESLQSELTRTRNGPFLEELQLVQQRSSVL